MKFKGCPGFKLAGVACGLKKNNAMDLGLIYAELPANVAGVFTRNKIKAAPVLLDQERIKSGTCQAIIVNSGNANCCTGGQGMRDAIHMTQLTAAGLGISEDLVMVASTGVIGKPLPMDKIEGAIPDLIQALNLNGVADFAGAIMTTDTVPKIVVRHGEVNGNLFTITGVAKGAGMIRPDMATLLCFVMTDLKASPDQLKEMLAAAVAKSLNRITIDGDTSTNDTVLLMASGFSEAIVSESGQMAAVQPILDDVFVTLAKQLVQDGEGVTKLVEVVVKGASSDADAEQIVDTVAHSNLLKTAFFGEDANWGRIFAAVGRAGVPVDPNTIDLYFDDVLMVQDSLGCGDQAESKATAVLKKPEFTVTIDLKMGHGSASMLTCDFSIDYVKINADYRS
ncbi:MAG: bifunctional glutamate N-acetyltransferase/amino-acid acetyltransferase ArgJ [Desulfobacterales bacterium]|nr:MAG: bifunctional glutamate N-acetyltransferase/amino-acid acetyltransferase ArgJ [Desulfobacterales bacterium]